ncbi:23670_t:CDS:2 [Cetraspora pellucida]|uniref:23670_t:CDS:1 n=1 Tax=Cetraspora pellucida TaxID=1433469 RepID=A0A9N8WIU3_9GLOM|nr:23670_t:CDS:2 [Cetraspora pellucida]
MSNDMSNDIYEIKQICLTARYNKSIRSAFIELVIFSTEPIANLLQYQKDSKKVGRNFDLEHLKLKNLITLEKFKNSLTNIKEFVKCVTQIHGSTKYQDVASIKEDFDQIIKEYCTCVKELNPNFLKMLNPTEQDLKDDEIEDFIKAQSLIQSLVRDKKLNYGLIICNRGINFKYKFETQIKINPINRDAGKFYINSVSVKTQMDSLLLKYSIKPSKINFEYFQLILNQSVNEPANQVYLEIQYPLWEIVFEKENMKLPEKLIKDIKIALEHNDPYHELLKVFDEYGYFVPSRVILGHKLYRMSCLKRNKTMLGKKKIVTREYFETMEFTEFWKEWSNSIRHFSFDELHLSSMNSGKFEREDIKEWASFLSDNNLQIICWDKLHSLYELLDNNLKRKVNYRFPLLLRKPSLQFKFWSIYSNLRMFWIMVGLPEIGFYSPNTRDISIFASGSHEFAYAKKLGISILVPENLPANWNFGVSFQYLENCDCGPKFRATIHYDKINNEIIITIHDESNIPYSMYNKPKNKYLLHWCFLPRDHEILVDNIKCWEILGVLPENQEMLDDNFGNQEIPADNIFLGNQMTSADNILEKRFNLSLIGQDVYERSEEAMSYEDGVLSHWVLMHYSIMF